MYLLKGKDNFPILKMGNPTLSYPPTLLCDVFDLDMQSIKMNGIRFQYSSNSNLDMTFAINTSL